MGEITTIIATLRPGDSHRRRVEVEFSDSPVLHNMGFMTQAEFEGLRSAAPDARLKLYQKPPAGF